VETLLRDIRYSIRGLLKRPGFTFIALVTLALGIGANTAIFSLVNTVLLRPIPVDKPGEIVSVSIRGKDDSMGAFSYPNFKDFRERNQVLSDLLIYRFAPMSLSRDGSSERLWGFEVSGNYFDLLGVHAIKGRTFLPEEDQTRLAHPVVVLSYGYWQRRFGGGEIIGREILLNNHPFQVIGVAPQGFKGTEIIYSPDLWVPISMLEWVEPGSSTLDNRKAQNCFAIGRLNPGVNSRQAEISLNALARDLGKEYPDSNEGQTVRVIPPGFIIPDLRTGVVSFTWVLMGCVGLVLLITCINLAGLLLARATDRRREIAVRLALGAKRSRLIRQLLTESLLLSVVGGAVGLALAVWLINFLLAFKPPLDFPLALDVSVDWRVLIFLLVVSIVAGAFFGLAPALQATRPALVTALKETGVQGGYRRSRLRSGLVIAQLALSLIFLISAGLVGRSLQQLQTMNPGFETNNRLALTFDLGLQGYDQPRGEQFYRSVVQRVESLPGIRSAAIVSNVPLSLNYNSNNMYVEGQPPERGANAPIAMVASAGTRYFETMGTPILFGREFSEQDQAKSESVVVVNETFVRRLMPGTTLMGAIDKRVSLQSASGPFSRIIGVAKDGKYFSISEDPSPFLWGPLSQNYVTSASLVARTSGNPDASFGAIRNEFRLLDSNLPLFDVKTLAEHMRLALFPARVAATVLGAFGVVALLLAAIGIYGVTSYAVAQRTREIGIRIALGAQLTDVLKLIVHQGVKLILIGVVLGLLGAFLLTRALTSVLYGVSATDPLVFVLIPALMILVGLLASYLPARRATKVDPLIALRYE
jgi:putative ABC transport system permease protein